MPFGARLDHLESMSSAMVSTVSPGPQHNAQSAIDSGTSRVSASYQEYGLSAMSSSTKDTCNEEDHALPLSCLIATIRSWSSQLRGSEPLDGHIGRDQRGSGALATRAAEEPNDGRGSRVLVWRFSNCRYPRHLDRFVAKTDMRRSRVLVFQVGFKASGNAPESSRLVFVLLTCVTRHFASGKVSIRRLHHLSSRAPPHQQAPSKLPHKGTADLDFALTLCCKHLNASSSQLHPKRQPQLSKLYGDELSSASCWQGLPLQARTL